MSVAPNRRGGKKVPLTSGPRLDCAPFSRGSARSQPVAGDRLGDGGAVENVAGRFGHLGENPPDLAGRLVLAVRTAAIGDLAQARQRRDRAVDDPEHAPESDLIGRRQQSIAAELGLCGSRRCRGASGRGGSARGICAGCAAAPRCPRSSYCQRLRARSAPSRHIVPSAKSPWNCPRNPICWIGYRVSAVKTTVPWGDGCFRRSFPQPLKETLAMRARFGAILPGVIPR